MKATTLLERQHRNMQQLCEAVERGSARIRESLLPQLAGDLVAHIAVEEQVFYPAACQVLQQTAPMLLGRSRHAQVQRALDRVFEVPLDGEAFEHAIGELRQTLEVHVEEEEEALFPSLERALDTEQMRQLSRSMLSLYHAKVEAGYVRAAACTVSNAAAAP